MARMTDDVINKVIKKHEHWLNEDCDDWQNFKANLKFADLRNVDLSNVNLKCADLQCADLRHANLCDANLGNANLNGADLRHANLSGADLSGADLREANLRGTSLMGADLSYIDLYGANLRDADLRKANLYGASLINADLSGSNFKKANLSTVYLEASKGPLIEYRKGKILTEDIIGYKKCKDNIIVTLKIPRGSIVFSINGTKCRTNKAIVIDIDGSDRAISIHNYMSYYVGDEINVYDFNCEYNTECAEGIHFYMTREEAENHC